MNRKYTTLKPIKNLSYRPEVFPFDISTYLNDGTKVDSDDSVTGGFKNLITVGAEGLGILNDQNSAFPPIATPELQVRGPDSKAKNIEATELDAYLDKRTEVAQARLPYVSTLQLDDNKGEEMIETIEDRDVPLGFQFVHISTEEGELMRAI